MKTDIIEDRMIQSFLDLEIYQESLQLAKEINFLVRKFPKEELFLLVDQMKRASRAVPSLIAEGWQKRKMIKEFKKYLRDASGECNEMMNHLKQAEAFEYLNESKTKELIQRYDILSAKIYKLNQNWQNF